MKYGKIRIEDGYLAFTKHMMLNSLPCKDIMWAYLRREGSEGGAAKQLTVNYLVITTRRKKRYKFDMSEKEVHQCIRLLRALNPEMAVGFPRGSRIMLNSLPNTRDLGALAAQDGRHILPRKLLRSGELYHLSLSDQAILTQEYRLKSIIDFRSGAECREKPDTILPDVEYYHIPVLDEETIGLTHEKSITEMLLDFPGDVEKYMIRQYQNMIRDRISVKQYARFLDVLLRREEGCTLWHCSAGKDRAGVGTALLLCVLGIPREVIREDFMKSNTYLENEFQYMLRYLESRPDYCEESVEKLKVFYKVKPEYIDAVFQAIDEDYGNVDVFLRKALYLTPKAMESLKEKYLV